MKKRLFSTIFLLITMAITLSGCSLNQQKSVSKSGFYFDTIITITLYGTDEEAYINKCFDLASEYEKKFSNTISDSEISKINKMAGQDYVTVSDETLELIKKGISYGKKSDGKFDITIGKLSELWNLSEISKNLDNDDNIADESYIPSEKNISSLLPHINYKNIDIKEKSIYLEDHESKIDLGGIAKGYIADQMKQYLLSEGITSGIINLGGNILTIGKKTDNSLYTVGIQKPFDNTGSSIATVKIADKSVVTSGIYERYFKVDDKIYHHILDLSTGYPYENDLYSVTIISDSSTDGDALSTTCYALGLDKGIELIESLDNTEAIFIKNNYDIIYTSGIGNDIPFKKVN